SVTRALRCRCRRVESRLFRKHRTEDALDIFLRLADDMYRRTCTFGDSGNGDRPHSAIGRTALAGRAERLLAATRRADNLRTFRTACRPLMPGDHGQPFFARSWKSGPAAAGCWPADVKRCTPFVENGGRVFLRSALGSRSMDPGSSWTESAGIPGACSFAGSLACTAGDGGPSGGGIGCCLHAVRPLRLEAKLQHRLWYPVEQRRVDDSDLDLILHLHRSDSQIEPRRRPRASGR